MRGRLTCGQLVPDEWVALIVRPGLDAARLINTAFDAVDYAPRHKLGRRDIFLADGLQS